MQTSNKVKNNIVLHLHPAAVDKNDLKLNRTFGLGGMAALLIIIQLITGILLRFYYEPSPALAYDSIQHINNNVLFGQFIRNIHHWSAALLLITAFLHLLRVFFTGGFKDKRSINWLVGLALLVIIVLSNFTGYLLPWDQLAYWAVTVSGNILKYIPFIGGRLRDFALAGEEIGADTLLRYNNLHTSVFPLTILALAAYHFWKIRKAGGIIKQPDEESGNVPVIPHLVNREFVAALVLTAFLSLISVFFNAPLLGKANPAYSLNPTKSAWYFAGVQELLLHFHPIFSVLLIPFGVFVFLLSLPYMNKGDEIGGKWFYSARGISSVKLSAVLSSIFTILLVLADEYTNLFERLFSGNLPFISEGLLPFAAAFIPFYFLFLFLKKKYNLNRSEQIQVIFTLIIAAFVTLTIIGIFFRGIDMKLMLYI